jgi:hypothetical protein
MSAHGATHALHEPAAGPHAAPGPVPLGRVAATATTANPHSSWFAFPARGVWKQLGAHILIPLFLGAGMALAYLGAFHQPEPHDLQVAVVGTTPASMVFTQTINDKAGTAVDARTVGTLAKAEALVKNRTIAAAYEATPTHATIVVSTAASATTADAAQKIFLPIAYAQHLPVVVDDVLPSGPHDTTGQGIFFLLVALTVGSYASAAAVAAVAGTMRVPWRFATAAGVSAVIAAIAVVVAGPIYQVIQSAQWDVWLLAWLYSFGVIVIGVGLHPLLGKWTTAALTLLFVMLNFTSSGGIFSAPFQPPFFAGMHAFWNGAAFIDAAQTLVYFPGQTFGLDALKLALWASAGLLLVVATHLWSVSRRRLADDLLPVGADERILVEG